jgi:uncharacterized repeat protein (TIGR01451 family)
MQLHSGNLVFLEHEKIQNMKLKLIVNLTLSLLVKDFLAQANFLNSEYNTVPSVGCYSSMSACLTSGSLPESGAQIIVDWTDGTVDTVIAYMAPNTQSCYLFEHSYIQPGIYNALVTVTSGTLGGQLVANQTIEWVITSTTNCGFFNVISMLNPSATFLSNVPYDVTNNAGATITIYPVNSFGNPYYKELDVNSAPYTVSVNDAWLLNNGYIQTSPDFSINSFDNTGKGENVPMNVTLQCSGTGDTPNLEISFGSAFQFIAPLQTGNIAVQVCNVSCGNFANSVIKIALPQGVVPDLTDVPNAIFLNDTVVVSVEYLSGCFSVFFPCNFPGNTVAGTILEFYVNASALGEQDFTFNSLPFTAVVLNSYDPNDKQSNLPAIIQPDVQENLIYRVRFQNDGNFPALNVVVRDTISTNLDLASFRFINSKHPVSYSVDASTREVVFRYSGINLAPSGEDLEGSQGFFTYSIDELPNLPLNSEIKNTAYIFFDFNPAIITNTTLNTNSYGLGINHLESKNVSIAPNPTNDQFTLELPEAGILQIYSLAGTMVWEQAVSRHEKIDITKLQKGVYHLHISTSQGFLVQKLMVD